MSNTPSPSGNEHGPQPVPWEAGAMHRVCLNLVNGEYLNISREEFLMAMGKPQTSQVALDTVTGEIFVDGQVLVDCLYDAVGADVQQDARGPVEDVLSDTRRGAAHTTVHNPSGANDTPPLEEPSPEAPPADAENPGDRGGGPPDDGTDAGAPEPPEDDSESDTPVTAGNTDYLKPVPQDMEDKIMVRVGDQDVPLSSCRTGDASERFGADLSSGLIFVYRNDRRIRVGRFTEDSRFLLEHDRGPESRYDLIRDPWRFAVRKYRDARNFLVRVGHNNWGTVATGWWRRQMTGNRVLTNVDTTGRVLATGTAAGGVGYLAASSAIVQNSLILGGNLVPAGLSLGAPLVTEVSRRTRARYSTFVHGDAVEGDWLRAIRALHNVSNDPDHVDEPYAEAIARMRNQLSQHLEETDEQLINEASEQEVLQALHRCAGSQLIAETPYLTQSLDRPELYAKACFARFAALCRQARALQAEHPGSRAEYWKTVDPFRSLGRNDFKSLASHADPKNADHLLQISVAYARLLARQHDERTYPGRLASTLGMSATASYLTGNPLPLVVGGGFEAARYGIRRVRKGKAFLRIDSRGRLVGKDGSQELLDPRTARAEQLFFSQHQLEQWKSSKDEGFKGNAAAVYYYGQIDRVLRNDGLTGYASADRLAPVAQARLLHHIQHGRIMPPSKKLSKEDRTKKEDRLDTLQKERIQKRGELAQVETDQASAQGKLSRWQEILNASTEDRERRHAEEQIEAAERTLGSLAARYKSLRGEIKLLSTRIAKLEGEIASDDSDETQEPSTVENLDNDSDFEQAFCAWVNEHVKAGTTKTEKVKNAVTGNTFVRIVRREAAMAAGGTAAGATIGAGVGFIGSYIPLLNVAANPVVGGVAGGAIGLGTYIWTRVRTGAFMSPPENPKPPASGSST